MAKDTQYIGDGVIVYREGNNLWLETENGRNRIALNADNWNGLLAAAKNLGLAEERTTISYRVLEPGEDPAPIVDELIAEVRGLRKRDQKLM